MKKSSIINEEVSTPETVLEAVSEQSVPEVVSVVEESVTDRVAQLKAVQDQAAQSLREGRYADAKRALKEAERLQTEESKDQWLAEAKAEREKALLLTDEGKLIESKQALERADELEEKAAGWKGRPRRLLTAFRSRLPHRATSADDKQQEGAETAEAATPSATDAVTESLQIVSLHSKIAAGVGLLPGGILNFVGVLAVQVPMVWRIARKFGHNVTKEQVRGVLVSLFTSVIPGLVGHGAGMAIASIPAMIAGTVVYFVATPILAYALTRAVGNMFIMHFESGGTLLTFDPKAFTEYFVNEFKKAGGTVRQAEEPVPETSATPA